MWTCSPPEVSAGSVARACVRGIRDQNLRAAVFSAIEAIEANNASYRELGEADRLHEIDGYSHTVPGVSAEQLRWLYSSRLVRGSEARQVYEALKAAAPHFKCLYCKEALATTLDHFVPKKSVGSFAIDPCNLVPACPRCNQLIGEQWSSSRVEQMLHPYFSPEPGRWLRASVVHSEPVTLDFTAEPDLSLPEDSRERLVRQFERLGLALHLARSCAAELAGLCRTLSTSVASADEVREDLLKNALVGFEVDPNDRRAVMYEALALDAWFCEGGFRA
ncbi:HNH endonuclease signature motif containing protein [Cellulosimicrobium aquatile]|uniref:HNH endonuclease signature motif containing protein n=1 Tax=Cellulosimicrobium aquatile TaxID=1612203 RepID=UPI003B8A6B83